VEGLTPEAVNEFITVQFPSAAAGGTKCVAIGSGTATARWSYDPGQLRPGGYISGPTQFALADAALWFAVFTVVGLQPMAVTARMSIDFLRPAVAADLYASATIVKVGRAGLVGRIHLWVGDDIETIVAIATGTYVAPSTTERRVD
jgi:uncharacterized protein (TIGR00369 family)